jgi:hypothetical protein
MVVTRNAFSTLLQLASDHLLVEMIHVCAKYWDSGSLQVTVDNLSIFLYCQSQLPLSGLVSGLDTRYHASQNDAGVVHILTCNRHYT